MANAKNIIIGITILILGIVIWGIVYPMYNNMMNGLGLPAFLNAIIFAGLIGIFFFTIIYQPYKAITSTD